MSLPNSFGHKLTFNDILIDGLYLLGQNNTYQKVSILSKNDLRNTVYVRRVPGECIEVTLTEGLVDSASFFAIPLPCEVKPNSLERGEYGYRHPELPEYCFSSEENARRQSGDMGKNRDAKLTLVDTRPTVKEMRDRIMQAENLAFQKPRQNDFGCAGPWDEYFQTMLKTDEDKFPTDFVFANVVFGSNEGIYLTIYHKAYNSDVKTTLMVGKTCSCDWNSWMECNLSLARINWMLNR